MDMVGMGEARILLTELLERVALGERIVITADDGKALAMPVPPDLGAQGGSGEDGRLMLAYRNQVGRKLGVSSHDLVHDGHSR